MNKRSHAVLVYFVVYLVAIILAGLSMKYFNTFIKETYQSIFYADLVGSLVVYTACMFYNNVSIYDPYWTVQASCISVYYFINWSQTTYNRNIESCDLRALLVFILVNTWSIRLTSNLFINSVKDINEEDWRYSDYRIKFPSKIVYFFVRLMKFSSATFFIISQYFFLNFQLYILKGKFDSIYIDSNGIGIFWKLADP